MTEEVEMDTFVFWELFALGRVKILKHKTVRWQYSQRVYSRVEEREANCLMSCGERQGQWAKDDLGGLLTSLGHGAIWSGLLPRVMPGSMVLPQIRSLLVSMGSRYHWKPWGCIGSRWLHWCPHWCPRTIPIWVAWDVPGPLSCNKGQIWSPPKATQMDL